VRSFLFIITFVTTFSSFAEMKTDSNLWIAALMDQALETNSHLNFYERLPMVQAQADGYDLKIVGMQELSRAGYIVLDSNADTHASLVVRVIKKREKIFEEPNAENRRGIGISPGAIEIGIATPLDRKTAKDISDNRNNPLDGSPYYLDPSNPVAILLDHRVRPESNLVTVVNHLAMSAKLPWNSVRIGVARIFEIERGEYVAVRNVRLNLPGATPAQIGGIVNAVAKAVNPWLKVYPDYDACLGILTNSLGLPLAHRHLKAQH
jgi:hypothetical protein